MMLVVMRIALSSGIVLSGMIIGAVLVIRLFASWSTLARLLVMILIPAQLIIVLLLAVSMT